MCLLPYEVSILEFIFETKSTLNATITHDDFLSIVNQIFNQREYEAIIEETSNFATSGGDKEFTLTKFVALIEMIYIRKEPQYPMAIYLHNILEQLRIKYVTDIGDYIKAGKVQEQIDALLDSEFSRRQQKFISKQKSYFDSLKQAHDEQYITFKQEWDDYFLALEKKANETLSAMKERHSQSLNVYLEQLEKEAQSKIPLWSKELKQFKKREKILASQENYTEAQNVKVIVEALEKEEQEKAMVKTRDGSIAMKESAFRQRLDSELQVLSKKIQTLRKTNEEKQKSDLKRLLQRNRNIQDSLRSKQVIECNQVSAKISKQIQKEIESQKVKS